MSGFVKPRKILKKYVDVTTNNYEHFPRNDEYEYEDEYEDEYEYEYENKEDESEHPRTYKERKKREAENWKLNFEDIDKTMRDDFLFPNNTLCTENCNAKATIRCIDCGPCSFFCNECCSKLHRQNNIFHRQIYLSMPHKYVQTTRSFPPLCSQDCTHQKKKIIVIHLLGKI
jgi:hypothetical protein